VPLWLDVANQNASFPPPRPQISERDCQYTCNAMKLVVPIITAGGTGSHDSPVWHMPPACTVPVTTDIPEFVYVTGPALCFAEA
jgi:hypothetical protein